MGPPSTPPGDAFAAFLAEVEPRLRRALVAAYGPEAGREAAVDALAWAWEHWDRVAPMANPVGYLYRVGQTQARRARRREGVGTLDAPPPGGAPWVEPGLRAALAELSDAQRVAVVLCHGFAWTSARSPTCSTWPPVPYGPLTGPEVEVPVPAPWPALPEVGERLVPRPVFPYADEVALRVAPGTALVGPELANAGPPRFVLVAPGDPDAALAAYVDQVVAAQDGAVAEPVVTTEVEGRTVRRQEVPIEADGTFVATAVSRPGRPTDLVLERLHD